MIGAFVNNLFEVGSGTISPTVHCPAVIARSSEKAGGGQIHTMVTRKRAAQSVQTQVHSDIKRTTQAGLVSVPEESQSGKRLWTIPRSDMSVLLSDDVWLSILRHLKPNELTSLASVSSRFLRLFQDRELWRNVDLSDIQTLTILRIRKLLERDYAVHIQSLRFEGYLKRERPLIPGDAGHRGCSIVTVSLLQLLGDLCPYLVELHVNNARIEDYVSPRRPFLVYFPKSLRFLGLDGCIVSDDFFEPLVSSSVLPQLQGLSLRDNDHHGFWRAKTSVTYIFGRPNLKALYLSQFEKLSAEELNSIPSKLLHLETLCVSDMSKISDEFLQNVAANCGSLRSLDISSTRVTDEGISYLCDENLSRCYKTLEKLYLSQTQVTDGAVGYLSSCKSLRNLSVVGTQFSQTGVDALNATLQGKCKVFRSQ